jgi:hypothetical protein
MRELTRQLEEARRDKQDAVKGYGEKVKQARKEVE